MSSPVQSAVRQSWPTRLDWAFIFVGLVLLVAVVALARDPGVDGGDMRTRNTVRLSLAWYAAALCLMMRLDRSDWAAETRLGRITRWCWTWCAICFAVHLATAFHYFHQWSHEHAFEVTRTVSGVGYGIYSLYVFVAIALTDTVWWWTRPASYASRSPLIDRVLHAFMLFIVFNGMIVFESGPIRWAGILLFALLIVNWISTRGLPKLQLAATPSQP